MATKTLRRSDGSLPVIGDTLPITITIINVPSGTSIVKAWITFKAKLSDSDVDAILQKTITSGFTGTSSVAFTFTLTATETAVFIAGRSYRWDVQVKDNTGGIFTPIPDAEVTWQKSVTDAAS